MSNFTSQPFRSSWPARLMRPLLVALALLSWSLTSPAQYNGVAPTLDGSVKTGTTGQTALFPSTPDTLLTSGDQISIRVFNDPEYNIVVRIGVDGTVVLPLLGNVNLTGLTISGAEKALSQQFETAGMYHDPQVILQITEGPSSIITLSGEMHAVIPVVGSRNLLTVLSQGGGLPPNASRTITVLRPGQAQPISLDVGNDPLRGGAANIPIFPGDTIIVSRIGVVYVMGEFRSPGIVPMSNYGPLTLTQVSAQVGGPAYAAKYSELHIIRTVGDHRTVTTLNIKNVLYGKAPDPIMQPNDIVFLPPSPWKSSISNGSLGSILGVVSFALATIVTFR